MPTADPPGHSILHKQDSQSVPPRAKPAVHFAPDADKPAATMLIHGGKGGAESDPGFDTRPTVAAFPRADHHAKPIHVRIREAFAHLTHHQPPSGGESSSISSSVGSAGTSEFKQPHAKTPVASSSHSQQPDQSPSSTGSATTAPIAIPSPRKHRSFWGFLGRRLEREEIVVPESPARSSGAQSAIRIDDVAMEMLKETVPQVCEPSDVTFSTKYRFVNSKVIGKGASGVVRLACRKDITDAQLSSTTLLAVKEFRRRRRDESQHDYLRKITAEYCIATTMHHVNVIETVDIVHDRERWYEVMEYCPGGDLFNAIAHGDLDDQQIDSCFRELVEGVHYLHSLGVAHRDLKPENILVDSEGHVRICDFGVSDVFKVVWERTPHKSRGICGSCPYIAPEEFGGDEYDAQKVDVWSLGIIYYAMTFHSVPWDEATVTDAAFQAYLQGGQDGFEPFQRLPKHSRDLLKGMLHVDPSKRLSIEQVRESAWLKRVPFVPLPVIPTVVINNGHSRSSSSASGSGSN